MATELAELKQRVQAVDMALSDEGETTCCHACSEKHWAADPQGVAWKHFHIRDNISVFNEPERIAAQSAACCTPHAVPVQAPSCCTPNSSSKSCG